MKTKNGSETKQLPKLSPWQIAALEARLELEKEIRQLMQPGNGRR